MSKKNYFFSLTETEEIFTEKYLEDLITQIQIKEDCFNEYVILKLIKEHYFGVKINKNAILRLINQSLRSKAISRKKRRRYFFSHSEGGKKYSEEGLLNCIYNICFEKTLTQEELFHEVNKEYSGARINYSAFKKLIDEKLEKKGNCYTYTSERIKKQKIGKPINKWVAISSLRINSCCLCTDIEIDAELEQRLLSCDDEIEECISLLFAKEIKEKPYLKSNYISKLADISIGKSQYIESINVSKSNIIEKNLKFPISQFIQDKTIIKRLSQFGIKTAEDIKQANEDLLLLAASENIKAFISDLDELKYELIKIVQRRIDQFIEDLLEDDKKKDIILARYGYFNSRPITLEELGIKYEVTRERIRQIESSVKRKLEKKSYLFLETVNSFFDYYLSMDGCEHKDVETLIEEIGDPTIVMNACLLLSASSSKYLYDGKYHIIYNPQKTSIREIEGALINNLGNVINKKHYLKLKPHERGIIKTHYRKTGELYLKKGYRKIDVLEELVLNYFPEGFSPYNNNDYSLLVDKYQQYLGEEAEIPSQVAVRGYMDRDEFCLVKKGTYRPRIICASIPLELFNRIFDFIVDHLPVVDYITIFNHFKNELESLGITNYYYMKGAIDVMLPDDLTTKRNYITETDNRITAVEARLAYMRSFDGAFTLDDLENKYPGVKPYVFQFMCYEECKNGLVQIGRKKFAYSDKLNITNEQSTKLKNIIEELFRNTNTEVLAARKVYAKTRLSYPDLLEEMPYIEDQFSMFSVIKHLFSEDYYLDRPYISKVEPDVERLTTRGVILDYLNDLDTINYDLYRDYCMRMNIPMRFSYMQLVDELSENYVQIDDRQMIKKERFDISEKELQDIERVLELILSRTAKLETSTFNGYMMLPQTGIKWSKHVFAGIIRSYFSEKYEVINITKGAKSEAVDYEIERYEV